MTVDQIFSKIASSSSPTLEEVVSKRDARVLRSFASILNNGSFFTENQSKLLVKILKDNLSKLENFEPELSESLTTLDWSKGFRHIEVVRRMYISTVSGDQKVLAIDFTYSNSLRKLIHGLSKNIEGLLQIIPGKSYIADLTENNISVLVDTLAPLNFIIDDKVKNHYDIIKSWSESEVKNQFLITSITNSNFQKCITEDLGINTSIDKNIIADRSMRYQYFAELTEKPENLTEKIANRKQTKFWINKKETDLHSVLSSIEDLRRFPLLVVFDQYDNNASLKELKDLSENLEKFGIFDKIGIYFRLSNDPVGKEFNQYIGDKKLNCQLDATTQVVGVQSGKIPKFLLKSDWKPMCVLSLGNNLRNSKTAVYSNVCDLIITYSESEPIVETRIL